MINKNKFSIKDTKKVLHKVGKKWVVVSAVLLGLAAGGAAVTTANADTTANAAQPTAAQQVAKNANMSSANHSFGAADPANATKSGATMKLGATNGINDNNGLMNSVKSDAKDKLANHNLPSTVSGMKSYAKSKASSADVNHLTDLANLARKNGQQSAYSDLVNLANNDNDRFNSIEVGSDTTANSDPDTLFGMLNDAYSDVSAINNGHYSNSTVSKVAHYLSDAQKKLANSNVSHAFNASQLNSMVSLAGASELPTSVPVSGSSSSINLASYLPNNLKSSINALPEPMKENINRDINKLVISGSVSNTTASVAPSYTLNLNIPSVVNNGINVSSAVSSAVNGSNGIVTKASNSIQSQAASIAHNLDNRITNSLGNSESGVIASLNNDIGLLHLNSTSITSIDNNISQFVNTALSSVNNGISSTATSDFSSEIPGSSLASKITQKLYSMGIGGPNKSFGPFTSDPVSPAAAASFLTSNSNGIDSLLSQFVPNASSKVNKVINLLNKASNGLDAFDEFANSDYTNLVSAAANLANDNNYPSAHSAYSSIASNATNLNSLLSWAESHNHPIPKYSDVSAYASNQIIGEAKSSVTSMDSTSASMNGTLNEAETDANNSSLENTLLGSVISKLSTASADYNGTLTGQDTSEALDSEAINFMSDNVNVGTSNVVGTPNETFNAQSLTAPAGYSLASDATDNATITINNGSANVDVVNTNNTPESGGGYIPFIPSFNNGSSVNTYYEPSTVSGNVESTVRYANYVLVTKALQLHTKPNFTKRNGVAVIKPGVVLNVEKTVRARHNFVRYEVRYNNKNYFVTANKHFVAYNRYELAQPSHYRYAKVDTALQLHQSTNFTKKNGVKVVKPGAEFRINRVVKSNKGVTRYEVNYKDSVYFITASSHYVENAYLQKSNFNKRGHKAVRAAKPVNEYRHVNFSKRGVVRHFRRGTVLPVRRVFTIGKGEVTRLQLTNGRYVSANKDLVKVIK